MRYDIPGYRKQAEDLIRGLFDEFFCKHDIASAEKYLHPDYIQHDYDVPPGVKGFQEHFSKVFSLFPEFHVEIKHIFVDEDIVIMHGYGVTKPGEIEVLVVDMYRMKDQLLYEHWGTVQQLPKEQFGNPGLI